MNRVVIVIALLVLLVDASEGGSFGVITSRKPLSVRGGSTDSSPPKRTRKRKKRVKDKEVALEEEKKVIQEAMREKDAETALGDAIRERADQLRSEMDNPLLQKIDQSVSSVGLAMGTSDQVEIEEDGGGVEAAPTSVLANYFLKSHGGAHALQCVCSLLAALSATGALMVSNSSLRLIMMRRAMLFAMTKHVSGLLAVTSMTATAIPEVGLRRARAWIEQLARDPVSQYVFYAALIMLWLPSNAWWLDGSLFSRLAPFILLGPILLREVASTAFVISDILVLLTTSGGKENAPRILQIGQSIMNAFMSILVTPSVWRSASAQTRQEILAKLTSRTSLIFELCVGLLLSLDALVSVWEFAFKPTEQRPSLTDVIKRIFCARLYLNFLWVRRRKIVKLGMHVRGGAGELPFRVLELVLHPKSSMGLEIKEKDEAERNWLDLVVMGLGMDE